MSCLVDPYVEWKVQNSGDLAEVFIEHIFVGFVQSKVVFIKKSNKNCSSPRDNWTSRYVSNVPMG